MQAWRANAGHFRGDYYDDILQAGRIAVWRCGATTPGHQAVVAYSAMIDEMRRVTPGGRRKGDRPQFVPWRPPSDDEALRRQWEDVRVDDACPESDLEAAQLLTALDEIAPGWPEALALHGDLASAGAALGVSESRACQVRKLLVGRARTEFERPHNAVVPCETPPTPPTKTLGKRPKQTRPSSSVSRKSTISSG